MRHERNLSVYTFQRTDMTPAPKRWCCMHGGLENLKNREKSGKVCYFIWSITASIDLDTKCAARELFTR